MTVETVRRLNHEGFSYSCRTVINADAVMDPILLVGGALMDMCGWRMMEEHLTPFASVITADLPGQGGADRLPPSYGSDFIGATITQMLQDIDVPRVNIVGNSYGAALAYTYAQMFPVSIARMVLIGAASEIPRWHRGALKVLQAHVEQGRMVDFGRYVISGIVNGDPSCVVRNREALVDTLKSYYSKPNNNAHVVDALQRARLQQALPPGGISGVPALIVAGEYDHVTPPREGRKVASGIEEAWFATIKEADHAAHAERPAEVADLVLRFFRNDPLDGLHYLNSVEKFPSSR